MLSREQRRPTSALRATRPPSHCHCEGSGPPPQPPCRARASPRSQREGRCRHFLFWAGRAAPALLPAPLRAPRLRPRPWPGRRCRLCKPGCQVSPSAWGHARTGQTCPGLPTSGSPAAREVTPRVRAGCGAALSELPGRGRWQKPAGLRSAAEVQRQELQQQRNRWFLGGLARASQSCLHLRFTWGAFKIQMPRPHRRPVLQSLWGWDPASGSLKCPG